MARLCLSLLVVIGCGRAVPPAAPSYIGNGHAPQIELLGNAFFTTAELLGILDTNDVGTAAAELERFYTGRGFVVATATVVEGTIVIEEGPLFRIGAIEVVELDGSRPTILGDDLAIAMLVGIPPHSVFARENVREALARIEARYRARGFEEVNAIPITSIDYERNVVDLRIEVLVGQRVISSAINSRIEVGRIWSLAGQQRREVFILRGLDQMQRRLA
jgi:outer membrane protein assembly factor BamA